MFRNWNIIFKSDTCNLFLLSSISSVLNLVINNTCTTLYFELNIEAKMQRVMSKVEFSYFDIIHSKFYNNMQLKLQRLY